MQQPRMNDELAVRARIQILLSLAVLDASLNSKLIETLGFSLETINMMAKSTHYQHILEGVAFDALPEGSWVESLRNARGYWERTGSGDANEYEAIQKFLRETANLVS